MTNNKRESHHVSSKDCTHIGYQQLGRGPGLILVQGTMGTAYHFAELAEALADDFTVYVPDRRGRGMSQGASAPAEHDTQKEIDDLAALLYATGASFVFGLSSGAIITLQAALVLPVLRKVAIYEPPLFVDGLPTALLQRFDREWAQGNVAAAMVTAMLAAQMGPPIFKYLPRFVLEGFVKRIMQAEAQQAAVGDAHAGQYPTMLALAATLPNDFRVVAQADGALPRFSAIQCEVLLLGGRKSPAYLRRALDTLARILPHQQRVELPGLGHAAAWNRDKQRNPDGDPQRVAQVLREYFVGIR